VVWYYSDPLGGPIQCRTFVERKRTGVRGQRNPVWSAQPIMRVLPDRRSCLLTSNKAAVSELGWAVVETAFPAHGSPAYPRMDRTYLSVWIRRTSYSVLAIRSSVSGWSEKKEPKVPLSDLLIFCIFRRIVTIACGS
jgi:hypothetical protein